MPIYPLRQNEWRQVANNLMILAERARTPQHFDNQVANDGIVQQLEKVKELLDAGAIAESEFAKAKSQLLHPS
jgi:hypothetical protein